MTSSIVEGNHGKVKKLHYDAVSGEVVGVTATRFAKKKDGGFRARFTYTPKNGERRLLGIVRYHPDGRIDVGKPDGEIRQIQHNLDFVDGDHVTLFQILREYLTI
jgi:hypothetical protein